LKALEFQVKALRSELDAMKQQRPGVGDAALSAPLSLVSGVEDNPKLLEENGTTLQKSNGFSQVNL
jgi:hypothetical protein